MTLQSAQLQDLKGNQAYSQSEVEESLPPFYEFNTASMKNQQLTVQEMFAKHLLQLHGVSADKARAVVDKVFLFNMYTLIIVIVWYFDYPFYFSTFPPLILFSFLVSNGAISSYSLEMWSTLCIILLSCQYKWVLRLRFREGKNIEQIEKWWLVQGKFLNFKLNFAWIISSPTLLLQSTEHPAC